MPFSYHIDTKVNYAVLHGAGVITDAEYKEVVEHLYADPNFNPELRTLVDLRDVSDNQISIETLEKSAKESRYHVRTRRAIIVSRTHEFKLAREHQALLTIHAKSRPRIFHSAQDALGYLNEDCLPGQQIR